MDIGAWLRGLGLCQYEATFVANKIDADILPELTEADLGQLGVLLYWATASGCSGRLLACPQRKRAREAPGFVAARAVTVSAERRQLTADVLRPCRFDGFIVMLDPEDMGASDPRSSQGCGRGGCCALRRTCSQINGRRHSGSISGYPRAHEDDAERAARAGLGIVEGVETLRRDRGIALKVRAGIATGLVVVGELMGEGEAQERGVVGDMPNLAARLQALAEPGSVVVASHTAAAWRHVRS